MATKRLFWYFSLHGGAVGQINLGAGNANPDDFIMGAGFILQLTPVTSAAPATFDFGTIAEPTLLTAGWAPGDLITGEPRNFLFIGFDASQNPTVASPWAIRINSAPLTGGVIETWFQTIRRT